jgi:hypothetical protein
VFLHPTTGDGRQLLLQGRRQLLLQVQPPS